MTNGEAWNNKKQTEISSEEFNNWNILVIDITKKPF